MTARVWSVLRALLYDISPLNIRIYSPPPRTRRGKILRLRRMNQAKDCD
jgi:hypothetical protein